MKYIPVNIPLIGNGNEKKYVDECISSGWISSEGGFVSKFESEFAKYIGKRFAVSVTNGSSAIDLSIKALGLKAGDEVIMPTFTIISCISYLVTNGIKPVLVDADPITWNMDTASVEEKINENTKAIMIVHIYGLPTEMEPINNLAKKYDLLVIEDSAEAHGQSYFQRKCGSFGDVSTFSFYANKHITCGEGGMVLTDDEAIYDRLSYFKNLCFENSQRFVHHDLGWNFRMTNLQAALGLAQLEQIDKFIQIKQELGNRYNQEFASLENFNLPCPKTAYADNHYWVYGLVAKSNTKNAKYFINKLHERGIGTRPFFWPMHKQPVLNKLGLFLDESHPVSEFIAQQGFYIPSGIGLAPDQIDAVIIEVLRLNQS